MQSGDLFVKPLDKSGKKSEVIKEENGIVDSYDSVFFSKLSFGNKSMGKNIGEVAANVATKAAMGAAIGAIL